MQLRSRGLCSKEQGEKQSVWAEMCCSRAPRAGTHWLPAHQLHTWESPEVTPPSRSLNFPWILGRSAILQPMCGFSCCYLFPRAAQGTCLFLITAGWVCSTSSAIGSSLGLQPPLALTQLLCHHFGCSNSRYVCPNHICYWLKQNITCSSKVLFHIFPPSNFTD